MSFRTSSSAVAPLQPPSQNVYSEKSFDSSMVLTVLVLLSALFFMAFFSIYIRRFSADPEPDFTTQNRRPLRADARIRRKGVDPEVFGSLPAYSFHRREANTYEILECAICLGEFEEKEIVKMIPYCKHVFHLECIGTWLKMHVTCPVCRGTRLFEEDNGMGGGGDGGAPPYTVEDGGNEQNRRLTVENVDTCIEVGEMSRIRDRIRLVISDV